MHRNSLGPLNKGPIPPSEEAKYHCVRLHKNWRGSNTSSTKGNRTSPRSPNYTGLRKKNSINTKSKYSKYYYKFDVWSYRNQLWRFPAWQKSWSDSMQNNPNKQLTCPSVLSNTRQIRTNLPIVTIKTEVGRLTAGRFRCQTNVMQESKPENCSGRRKSTVYGETSQWTR